jgi:alpha-ketoglutarate-dependent taurine dioxygenase
MQAGKRRQETSFSKTMQALDQIEPSLANVAETLAARHYERHDPRGEPR